VNLILLEPEDFLSGDPRDPSCDRGPQRVRLGGRQLRHVREVHRAEVGRELAVGVVGGPRGRGEVVALDENALEMEVLLDGAPPPPLPVTLLLALPRPKVLSRLLRDITTFGVKEIVLLRTWRVEQSFWQSPALEPERIRRQLLLGLEQAGDTVLPRVRLRRRFKPFVEDELPGLAEGTLRLLAHPGSSLPCPRGVSGPITLAVGPEGGFIPYEVEALEAQGFQAVTLGERPLRVETAVAALLARLS
jgi:RsmE family RNA methyltransferase